MCSEVVSARISRKNWETLREAGVDVSLEIGRHLGKVAAEIRRKKSIERLHNTIDTLMPPSKEGYAARSVREDRERN